jgi:DNA-binding transcriptional MocR family regulator
MYQGELGLLAPDVWFISYILAHKWDTAQPYPSLNHMARETGVSVRQIQYLRKGLENRGYLTVEERRIPTRRQTQRQVANGYDFGPLFAALETLVQATAAEASPIQEEGPLPALPDEEADTSFAARYGRVLLRAGIAAVPRALFTYQAALALSPQQVWFISYILAYKWTTALPYPSLMKMADRTGYSISQIQAIKKTLVDRGYLRVVPRYYGHGGQAPSAYDFAALFAALGGYLEGAAAQPAPVVPDPAPPGVAAGPLPPRRKGQRTVSTMPGSVPPPPESSAPPLRARPLPSTPAALAAPANGRSLRPSTPPPPPRNPPESPPTSKFLAAVITDFSRELHDEEHTRSNITQTLRLWQRLEAAIGMDDATFADEFVQVAKRRTRKAQGQQGLGQIENTMAYFFEVLRDLVEQRLADGAFPAARLS